MKSFLIKGEKVKPSLGIRAFQWNDEGIPKQFEEYGDRLKRCNSDIGPFLLLTDQAGFKRLIFKGQWIFEHLGAFGDRTIAPLDNPYDYVMEEETVEAIHEQHPESL